jgi:hypothetical protein
VSDEVRVACEAWDAVDHFLKFDGVLALAPLTELYSDAECTTVSVADTGMWAVYANTVEEAQTICDSVIPARVASKIYGTILGTHVWACFL